MRIDKPQITGSIFLNGDTIEDLDSLVTTSSLNSYTGSNNTRLNTIESTTGSLNSYTSSNNTIIGSLQTGTSSLNNYTSSNNTRLSCIEIKTGSYATTGSNTFCGNLTVTGYIDAQELRTTYISSSILYRSGSTKFGDELSDNHSFTGSMLISGSISVPGSNLVSGSAQIDVLSTTNIARLATTGSNIFSGSQIVTGSVCVNGSLSLTTPLSVANGGTGLTTLSANKVMIGNGTTGVLTPSNLHWDNTNSRLGINTTTPRLAIDVANGGVNSGATSGYYLGVTAIIPNGAAGFYHSDGTTNGNFIVYANLGGIQFNAEGAQAITIKKTSGNVGIGTTSPVGKLQLQSTNASDVAVSDLIQLRVLVNGTDYYGSSTFHYHNNTQGIDKYVIGVSGQGGTTTTPNNIAQAKMVIQANGNVGIGTTSPVAKLEVNGGIKISETQEIITSGMWYHSALDRLKFTNPGGGFGFNNNANNAEIFTILNNGNVGIGTTSPVYELQVGTSGASMSIGGVPTLNGTGRLKFLNTNTTKNWQISINDTVAGAFEITPSTTNGGDTFTTPLMLISSGGAVTIANLANGTVTSSNGTLSATSDMNLKISDGYIDNALDKIMNLKPRYFYWKEETGLPTNIRQLGFYAQEVNQSLGEEASNTPKNENDKWGIYDRSIIAMLTKAIQEQQSQIDILKQEIINLKNK